MWRRIEERSGSGIGVAKNSIVNEIDFMGENIYHVTGYAGNGVEKHQILTTNTSYTAGVIDSNLSAKVDNGYFEQVIKTKADASTTYTKEETDARIRQIIHEIIGPI